MSTTTKTETLGQLIIKAPITDRIVSTHKWATIKESENIVLGWAKDPRSVRLNKSKNIIDKVIHIDSDNYIGYWYPIDEGFYIDHLPEKQRKIAEVILDAAFSNGLNGWQSGCRVFYSPQEWKARKEEYGTDSELIVVYDDSDIRYQITQDGCYETLLLARSAGCDCDKINPYSSIDRVQNALKGLGMHLEECTTWYSAVYRT